MSKRFFFIQKIIINSRNNFYYDAQSFNIFFNLQSLTDKKKKDTIIKVK